MVLAMVISLSAILVAPPAAAQERTADCNPTPEYNGCHLEVAVSTYIKTTDGDFIPQTNFSEGQCFYVNAVVVNTGNATAIAPINATISFNEAHLSLHTGEVHEKTWTNGNLTYASPEGLMADFWWQVCCDGPYGKDSIKVSATAAQRCDNIVWPAVGCTTVNQGTSTTTNCLEIEIVEAPGMPDKVGELGNYTMSMPGTVSPCTNFGIKAELINHCTTTLNNVLAQITWTGPASLVGGDPDTWNIGSLAPGQTKGVAWTLHCDNPGDVKVTVTSPTAHYKTDNPWTVHQEGGYGLTVDITKPTCTTSSCNPTCTIEQPSGTCGAEFFTVEAKLHNSGDSALVLVYAIVTATPSTGWVQLPSPAIKGPYTILPGANQIVQFEMKCIGNGTGNVTVTATGADSRTGLPVNADDFVTIEQTYLTATATPDPAIKIPTTVNKCQNFDVTFRYMNYSGAAWNDDVIAPGSGNITACIHWQGATQSVAINTCGNTTPVTGNATLIDSVYYRRIIGGIPQGWILLETNPVVTGNDSVGYTSCVHIPVICNCCGAEVKWTFKCTNVGPVKFYSTINVQQTNPVFVDNDTSETVCVNQVWKAHLTADSFFFIQTDSGEMIMQSAVVPGTQFHVVIPVINTGDADAQNVEVYFILSDAPGDPQTCPQSFEILSSSGDAVSIVAQGGGAYIATFPLIKAHSAVKATLVLECLCEGDVQVWVPDAVAAWGSNKGVRGYDKNTGQAIPQANIVCPPCPREMEQIPFTVEIINPYTCQTFNKGETFPVKARITNGASQVMYDVYATLTWGVGDNVELVQEQGAQTATKLVGNISADSITEITWELRCTGDEHDSGEVWLGVSAESSRPALTAFTVNYPNTVNVHQIAPPAACLEVRILSPDDDQDYGQDWDVSREHPMIATGQEFAVTAKIMNHGPHPAENVIVTVSPNCRQPSFVVLAENETGSRTVGTLGPNQFVVETFTLVGGGTSDWYMQACNVVNDTICVNATSTTMRDYNCGWAQDYGTGQIAGDYVDISVYPAAYLVAEIEDIDPTSILNGTEFTVNYKVTNYGVADAWGTSVMLSVNPDGSVRIAEGQGGYTQMLSTIPGWSWGEPYNFVEGSFTLQGAEAGLSTLTITPAGIDECGWHAVLCCEEERRDTCAEYNWVQDAGRAIQSRFLISDSETVNQLENGQLDLAITKTVDNASPAMGQIVNFTITVTNNGPTAASGIQVTDAQPAGLTFGAAIPSQGTFSAGVWNVGNLVVGGSASLKIMATVTSTSQITNVASITAIDQPDGDSSNNYASVVLNKTVVTSASFTLKAGWNLISLPLIPNNGDITVVLAGVWGSFERALTNDPLTKAWSSYIKDGPTGFTVMQAGKGYWVKMSSGFAGATIQFSGVVALDPPELPVAIPVAPGWSLIGFKSLEARTAGDYLGNVKFVRIWSFANGAYSPITSGDMMQPGLGYWVAITESGVIYP